MPKFTIHSDFSPAGDQPQAIQQLVSGLKDGVGAQTLLGVTGSGKTFTMANVIEQSQKPTLILSHNKTLVAQLYGEFKHFFPDNAVEYFVSYYDYYQPEAFIPNTNTYIEKDLNINEEIEKMRLRTISSLLSGRRDVIVISSVSCIYGAGNPSDFEKSVVHIKVGDKITRNSLLYGLVDALYSRTTADFNRGNFRVKGDTVDIYLAYNDFAYRVLFFGDEIEDIISFDPKTGDTIETQKQVMIYPANLYVSPKDRLKDTIRNIQDDMVAQVEFFKEEGRYLEAKRLEDRVTFDLEMIRELGYCSGIENYSRYIDKRNPGDRPFCLLDYFPDDYLMFVDESHVSIPQVKAMYGGDRSRKTNLVDYGFRLPAALDNRPLQFDEFHSMLNQVIYVSATPADFEIQESEGILVEQVIRPTGLLDPTIEIKPGAQQVEDLMEEIDERIKMGDRTLVTTLTKRMAEELAKYFSNAGIKCRYIHSEIKTIERVEILRDLRLGLFDVLIGVNLLREGLDLPEVSLVAILDADKEGFLRSERSLTQTIGRAARNVRGKVVMYADKITDSMRKTIEETNRRREKQMLFNQENGIEPQTIIKSKGEILEQTTVANSGKNSNYNYNSMAEIEAAMAADPVVDYTNKNQVTKLIEKTQKEMLKAAKEMEFLEAARLRDELTILNEKLKSL